MLPQIPSIGRIVHYIAYGTPGGEYLPEHRAAIITSVGVNGQVSLAVLNPSGMFFNECVAYDDTAQCGGTWHWPEMV
jgi:hypothetical protein